MRNFFKLLAAATLLGLATPSLADDSSFTIAAIPDTQNYTDYTHQSEAGFGLDADEMFLAQMRYIAENLESNGGDIAFVTSLGDVWQHQTKDIDPAHAARGFTRMANPFFDDHFGAKDKVTTVEIPTAREGYSMIAGKVPFSVVPGNHDYDSMWLNKVEGPPPSMGGHILPGVLHAGGLDNFRSLFGADTPFFKDKDWYVASHDGGGDSAQIFTGGGYRFLHIGLQFDAPDASLEWAAQVIAEHPGLPTIISTHDFLNNDGERRPNPVIDNAAVDPMDNNPQMVWDKLIAGNDQIFLVLSGHHHGQSRRVDDNQAGHKVWQMLSDYQDRKQTAVDAGIEMGRGGGLGDGWLRLLTFEMGPETPTIRVRTYSTHYEKLSRDTFEYAAWYKEHEKPKLSDELYHDEDDFTVELSDFRERFGEPQSD
ncbi:MAG: serine/threonine protein phosphatase [Novosphingobium sp.]|nr:serine/threonine protein phosphatase [Novosphingobium sp.]